MYGDVAAYGEGAPRFAYEVLAFRFAKMQTRSRTRIVFAFIRAPQFVFYSSLTWTHTIPPISTHRYAHLPPCDGAGPLIGIAFPGRISDRGPCPTLARPCQRYNPMRARCVRTMYTYTFKVSLTYTPIALIWRVCTLSAERYASTSYVLYFVLHVRVRAMPSRTLYTY